MFKLSLNFQEKPRGKQKKEEWQLFKAKNFQSLMYPCFTFCRILGIFSYQINASTVEVSKPYYILSIIITCVCGIYVLIVLFGSCLFGNTNMIILPGNLATSFNFVFGGLTMIATLILTRPRLRLLQAILKISSKLSPETYEKLSKLIHAKDIIGFPLVGFILTLIPEEYFVYQLYIHLAIFQMDMLYMDCVCILKACFKRISDNLANMRKVITNEPHISTLNYHDQGNKFLIMELKALKKQHLTISNTVRMLNMIFSLQLLVTVVITFSDITCVVYYYILFCLHLMFESTNTVTVLDHIRFLLYFTHGLIKIALIVWACETGKSQALQISTSIRDVINNTTDEQIKDELQLFSLQILHCDNRFSAKGFIVDAKLLATILGTISIYVMILFQFKHMAYSCKRMANNNTEVDYNN